MTRETRLEYFWIGNCSEITNIMWAYQQLWILLILGRTKLVLLSYLSTSTSIWSISCDSWGLLLLSLHGLYLYAWSFCKTHLVKDILLCLIKMFIDLEQNLHVVLQGLYERPPKFSWHSFQKHINFL